MGIRGNRQALQVFKNVAQTGVSLSALNATVTSSTIDVSGFNHIVLEFEHANDSATEIQVKMDCRDTDSTTWKNTHALQGAGSGNYTSYQRTFKVPVSADTNWSWGLDLNYKYIRFVITSTSGAAADTITMTARLGNIG